MTRLIWRCITYPYLRACSLTIFPINCRRRPLAGVACLIFNYAARVSLRRVRQLDIGDEALYDVLDIKSRDGLEDNIDGKILDGRIGEKPQPKYWGPCYKSEPDFFQRCVELAEAMDWREMLSPVYVFTVT